MIRQSTADIRLFSGADDVKEDINDVVLSGKTKQEIKLTIEENTYQGNMAKKMRLTTWRKINVK